MGTSRTAGLRAVLARAAAAALCCAALGTQSAWAQQADCAPPSDGVVFDAASGFQWEAATQTAALLGLVNHLRCQAGLAPVARDARLDAAATRHARYQVAHNVTSHAESASLAGFSGASAHERMRAAGFPVGGSGEVISRTHPLAVESFAGLSDAVYHRFVMLGSTYADVGIASERDPNGMAVTVINFGARARVAPGDRLILYPGAGQRAVPASFDAASEAPSPAPGAGLVGYPVSVQSDAGSILRVESFELREVGSDRIVPAVVHRAGAGTDAGMAGTDVAFRVDPRLAANESFLLPDQPLDPDVQYEARFAGSIDGRALSRTWRFRTRPAAALAAVQRAEVAAGQHLRIRLAACSASIRWSRTTNLEASVWSSGWMQVRGVAAGRGLVSLRDACGRAQTVAVNVLRS